MNRTQGDSSGSARIRLIALVATLLLALAAAIFAASMAEGRRPGCRELS